MSQLPLVFSTNRWLMMRLSHMGDVALTTGVLAYLGEKYNYRFDVLTRSAWAPLYEGHPYVDTIHSVDAEISNGLRSFAYFWNLSKQCKGMGFLDLHGTIRSYTLGALWNGPVLRYNKMRAERNKYLTRKDKAAGEILQSLSVPQRYALAMESAPADSSLLTPRIWLTDEEKAWATEVLHDVFGECVAPVIVHPFASAANKTWSPSHWHQLVALCEKAGLPWITLGQGSDMFAGNKRSLVNKTTIRQTCALLATGSILVSGDSGPVHLASAVQTPVVAMFGPTVREWGFYPLGKNDFVFEQEMACRPCSLHGTRPCTRNGECLQGIAPAEVFAQLQKMLSV